MNQHKGSQYMRDGRLLMRIDNAVVQMARCVQPKKISILRHDYSSVLGCSLQMPNILGSLQAEILNGGDIYAAPS